MDESVNKPVHLACCLIVSQTVFSCLLSKKVRLEHFFKLYAVITSQGKIVPYC